MDESNALKAIRETDDELIVGNYIVLFGGRDLEGILSKRKNKDGSVGEFFTPQTKLESPYTKSGRLYVDWEHGYGKYKDGPDAPGRDDILGYVNWETAKSDDKGVWAERALYRRNKYMENLKLLIDAGVVGNSTRAIPETAEIKANGEIEIWELESDTLTLTPMEPRMITENVVTAIKALGDKFPSAKAWIDAADDPETPLEDGSAGQENPQEEASGGVTIRAENVHISIDNHQKGTESPITEVRTMSETVETPEQVETPVVDMEATIKAAVAEAVAATSKAWQERLEAEPPINSPGFVVTPGGDEADRALEGNPFKSFGEQMMAVKNAAYGNIDKRLLPLQAKAILGQSEQIASEGGFLIGTEQASGLDKKVFDSGVFASRVQQRTLAAGTNSADFYGVKEISRATGSRFGGIRGYRVEEAGTITASSMKFFKYTLKPNKYAILVYATDEMLSDQSLLEQEIMEAAPLELAFMLDDDILNSAVAGYPRGVLQSDALIAVTKETGQAADTIVAENIDKMWARRWIRGNYVWFINQDCNPQLDALGRAVGVGGQLVYNPPGGIADRPYGRLKGAPVIETEFNATLGDQGDILLADFSQYKVAQAGTMKSASSIHVQFLTDQMAYRFTARYDGQATWESDLTPYKGTSTVSPFVALAERA